MIRKWPVKGGPMLEGLVSGSTWRDVSRGVEKKVVS